MLPIFDPAVTRLSHSASTEESERQQARLKGLDRTTPTSTNAGNHAQRPHKDVNTFINNQLKFNPTSPSVIPADQMKCNILKAQAEQNSTFTKNGE